MFVVEFEILHGGSREACDNTILLKTIRAYWSKRCVDNHRFFSEPTLLKRYTWWYREPLFVYFVDLLNSVVIRNLITTCMHLQ